MYIEDGTGNGYKLKVDSGNRLLADSVVEGPMLHHSSSHGQAFQSPMPFRTITTTGGKVFWGRNESQTHDLYLNALRVCCDGGTVSHDEVLAVTFYGGDSIPTGNETEGYSANINTVSGNTADVLMYYWDEVGDGMTGLSGGVPVGHCLVSKGSLMIPTPGFIIGYNKTMTVGLKAQGEVMEAAVTAFFYMKEKNT